MASYSRMGSVALNQGGVPQKGGCWRLPFAQAELTDCTTRSIGAPPRGVWWPSIIITSSEDSPIHFGPLNFHQTTNTSSLDFGRIVFDSPSAVLRPQSPKEISLLLASLSASSSFNKVTVAARGAGHSIHGQAQALDGIVIEMDSLPSAISIHRGGESGSSYADVSGGALWIELLRESLKFGLAPRSWTDYLYLSVGGTLSNAGISGQTFKHGPQISNVLQLDVKWVRAFYDDFDTFTQDQELLVSMPDAVDYVEGFIVLNEHSLHSSSLAFPSHLRFTPEFHSEGSYRVYYCIEFAIHDHQLESTDVERVVTQISRKMSHVPSHLYSVEVSYFDFLDRVRMEETVLRSRALWEVPHPWLNMFVPKSGIGEFKDLLLDNISPADFEGLLLIYPLLRDKWDANSSAVLPDGGGRAEEQVMYIVGVLRSANPATCAAHCLQDLLRRHRRVAQAATDPRIGAKQYLARHPSQGQWQDHFGRHWDRFVARKALFDPLSILAPGQGIFPPTYASSS
ncbi:hypothetical protein BHE74_00026610 [Ensete ventricosum]|nr:hypothetical protein BHE74_00026610 [Ensete ventricosum]